MNPHEQTAKHLADNLRRLRELRGWSQQQLADSSGVPRPTIANLESGDGNPTLSVLLRLTQALGTHLEQLISSGHQPFELCEAESLPSVAMGGGTAQRLHVDAAGTELLRLEVPPKACILLAPVRSGFQRLIQCESGKAEIRGQNGAIRLKASDLLRIRSAEGVEVECLGARAASLLLVTLPFYSNG